MHVLLHEPEIPGNTGSIARLCAGTGVQLHLSGKLGFSLDAKHVRRAGLDYWPNVKLSVHDNYESAIKTLGNKRYWLLSARAERSIWDVEFGCDDVFIFGCESKGLPDSIKSQYPLSQHLKIPTNNLIRSHNLANSVGIVMYEAIRQNRQFFPDIDENNT